MPGRTLGLPKTTNPWTGRLHHGRLATEMNDARTPGKTPNKAPNESPQIPDMQRRMIELAEPLSPSEGYNLTVLPDVRILRSDRPLARAPVLYEPGIVIVLQGRKRGFLGDEVYLYDAQHYLAVSVPVPFSMDTDASAQEPLLAIYFRLDFKVAADLMMQLDEHGSAKEAAPRSLTSTPMDERLARAVLAPRSPDPGAGPGSRDLLSRSHRRAGKRHQGFAHPPGTFRQDRQGDPDHSCGLPQEARHRPARR